MQALSSSIGGDIILFLPPGIQLLVKSGRYIITLGNYANPFTFIYCCKPDGDSVEISSNQCFLYGRVLRPSLRREVRYIILRLIED